METIAQSLELHLVCSDLRTFRGRTERRLKVE